MVSTEAFISYSESTRAILTYLLVVSVVMTSKINPVTLQMLNVIAVLGTLIVNSLANIVRFNGVTTGAVSDRYFNYFTPAGYVFSIWGVIYVLLFVFMVYQVRSSQRGAEYLRQIGVLYFLGALANIIWLVMFHYSYDNAPLLLLTPIPIVALLLILLLTYTRLGIGTKQVSRNERLAVQLPISVYLGWISVATIANIASTLSVAADLALIPVIPVDMQWIATAAMLVVALVLGFLMAYRRHDFAFGLVFVWAAVGIGVKQSAIPIISYTAFGAALIALLVILLLPFIMKKRFVDFYMGRSSS